MSTVDQSASNGNIPSEIVIAIDFSITSPGVAVWNKHGITVFALSEKVKVETSFELLGIRLILYPDCNKSSTSKVKRYLAKADNLVRHILKHAGETDAPNPRRWFVEGMAMQACGAVLDISEALGMFEHELARVYPGAELEKLAPSTVKKQFCGRGNAKKVEMTEFAMTDLLFGPALAGLNVVCGGKLKPDASPMTDLVDAYALLRINLTTI